MLPLSSIGKIQEKSFDSDSNFYSENFVSIGDNGISRASLEVLKREQVGYDEDIELVNSDNLYEYLTNKSKPFNKRRFIELFTTTFPHLSVKECKNIFRNNECLSYDVFKWDSDEIIFYNSEFESEINDIRKK
jgi:hypothetical protein